jgi:hypothetical protein
MGIFDDVFEPSTASKEFTPAEAFAGLLLLSNAIDGHVSDEECQAFVTTILRMRPGVAPIARRMPISRRPWLTRHTSTP